MKKILFIEDDPDQVLIYQTKAQMEGLSMMTTDTGEKAIQLARKEKPDLILLDLLLKGEDGLDVLERFREEKGFADIPVIVFTNYDTEECRQRAKKLGATDFVIKAQITPKEVVEMIKKRLGI